MARAKGGPKNFEPKCNKCKKPALIIQNDEELCITHYNLLPEDEEVKDLRFTPDTGQFEKHVVGLHDKIVK